MARTLSSAACLAAHAAQSGEVWVTLLTITHADLPAPIRVCNAGEDLVVDGETFLHCPFAVTVPTDSEDAPPEVTLQIDNVDRRISQAIADLTGDRVAVELSVALASSPTLLEAGPYNFEITRTVTDAGTIAGTLAFEDVINEPYPADLISPARFTSLAA